MCFLSQHTKWKQVIKQIVQNEPNFNKHIYHVYLDNCLKCIQQNINSDYLCRVKLLITFTLFSFSAFLHFYVEHLLPLSLETKHIVIFEKNNQMIGKDNKEKECVWPFLSCLYDLIGNSHWEPRSSCTEARVCRVCGVWISDGKKEEEVAEVSLMASGSKSQKINNG